MAHWNQSTVTVFILLGLSDDLELQKCLFTLFILLYIIGILGNSVIISLIAADMHLHSPMYFFIGNLSLVDFSLMTLIVPQLLLNILKKANTVPFIACITQLYFFVAMVTIESLFLGVMAYDRHVAICNPLRYTTVMSQRICAQLASGTWLIGFLNSLMHSSMVSELHFCGPNEIQSFFCDMTALLKLSCSDTSTNELLIFTESFLIVLVSVFTIGFSYVRIIVTVLRIRSSEGRYRAFYTCSSHLMVVTLFYVTIVFNYIRPTSSYSLEKDKVVSVIYTVITPMLNPFIYSLRNKQVKEALWKVIGARFSTHKLSASFT